jgi:glucoamylase
MENHQQAFGAPGTEPKWTHGAKDAVGTAYSTSSHLWFTLFRGVLNEVYYPTIDKPQLRDLQFMIAGPGFLHEEKRHLEATIEHLAPDPGLSDRAHRAAASLHNHQRDYR